MINIRTKLTKNNLEYINTNDISVTKLINKLIEKLRINDAHIGDENELQKDIQKIIRECKK